MDLGIHYSPAILEEEDEEGAMGSEPTHLCLAPTAWPLASMLLLLMTTGAWIED
jgi:hypothetical protein